MKSVHPKGRTTTRAAPRPDDAALGDLRAVARQALTRRGVAPATYLVDLAYMSSEVMVTPQPAWQYWPHYKEA